MPTVERVAEFADAALRIVERDGLAAVSFRSVAGEAGWSLGAVQKAFDTKNDLLYAALLRAQDRAQHQADFDPGAAPGEPDLATWLSALVRATLPLDAERRAAVLVGSAFAERAPFDPRVAAVLTEREADLRGQLARLFARGVRDGEVAPGLDLDATAAAVLAFAAGLAGRLLYDPWPAERVEATVEQSVRCLLGRRALPRPTG